MVAAILLDRRINNDHCSLVQKNTLQLIIYTCLTGKILHNELCILYLLIFTKSSACLL